MTDKCTTSAFLKPAHTFTPNAATGPSAEDRGLLPMLATGVRGHRRRAREVASEGPLDNPESSKLIIRVQDHQNFRN